MTNEMKYMTWKEYAARAEDIICLCVGSVEQHGPHLPMMTDAAIAYEFGLLLAEQLPMIVAPEVFFGYRSLPASGGGENFPGTTSLSGETLMKQTLDILEDFYRQGRRKFVISDGHIENQSFLGEAAYLLTHHHPDAKVVFFDWWLFVSDETLDELFDHEFPGWDCEHASVTETSLMMYLCPDLVHPDRIPDQQGVKPKGLPQIFPEPKGAVPESGILYTAQGASKEMCRALVEEVLKKAVPFLKENFE